jgi:hypothetical protein
VKRKRKKREKTKTKKAYLRQAHTRPGGVRWPVATGQSYTPTRSVPNRHRTPRRGYGPGPGRHFSFSFFSLFSVSFFVFLFLFSVSFFSFSFLFSIFGFVYIYFSDLKKFKF